MKDGRGGTRAHERDIRKTKEIFCNHLDPEDGNRDFL
jgi:hypothetical protein